MKFSYALLVASVLAVTFSAPLHAQQTNRSSSAELKQNEELFVGRVRQGVFGSCNKTAPIKDARQRSIACTCYANAYVNKYSAQELAQLNQWQNKNPEKVGIVVLMLSPERKICKIP